MIHLDECKQVATTAEQKTAKREDRVGRTLEKEVETEGETKE